MKNKESETQQRQIKIFLVDDHPLIRKGISKLINAQPDMQVVGEAEDAPRALKGISIHEPDLVVVDISLPGNNGIELIKNLKALFRNLPVLVLSMHNESVYAQRSLRAGARGYIMKDEVADKVVLAIRRVLSGEIYVSDRIGTEMLNQLAKGEPPKNRFPVDSLSDRELEVVQLIGEGLSTREIAGKLNVSIKTIESHRTHIKEKLSLKSGPELVEFAEKWVEEESSMK